MSTRKRNAAAQAQATPRRRVLMAVTLALPFLLFGLLEAGLRLAHYGPDLSLFASERTGGRQVLIMNPDVKARYFSRIPFTPNTSYDAFARERTARTFRLFCLGGSTTAGFPYGYSGSFSSFLRDRLQALFPEKEIEVINLGMTATNSFTVVDLAGELMEYGPDAVLVYDGHNEFYGALGGASRESAAGGRWLTRLWLRLVHLRTVLLARTLFAELAGAPAPEQGAVASGTMMERLARGQLVPTGDAVYARTLATFRDNLDELVALCTERGVPLLLSTQVSNLRHRPPFFSGPAAPGYDTVQASTWYVRAQEADARGALAVARTAYIRARDEDQLRFRATSDFNEAIRACGGRGTCSVIDMERVFAAASPDSIIGRELILEHLHPSLGGYFLMARAYAAELRRRGLPVSEQLWAQRDTINDDRLREHAPLTVIDERAAARRIALLTSGWPFNAAPPAPPPAGADPVDAIVEQLVGGRITWEQAHVAAARHFEAAGDTARVVREFRVLINQLPLNVSGRLILAQHMVRWRRLEEAASLLRQAVRLEPGFYAYRTLGGIALERGAHDSAATAFGNALPYASDTQERTETGYLLAVSLLRSGRTAEALRAAEQVLSLDPGYAPARAMLRRITGAAP